MSSTEVQRTLVKSPPELWAELSDPAALARHLGELGEIRITRVQPEEMVEWEAGGTSGTIRIKPSGWGTKVTLSVTREPEAVAEEAVAEEAVAEPDAMTGPEPPAEPEPLAEQLPAPAEPEHEPVAPEPEAVAPEPEAVAPEAAYIEPEPDAFAPEPAPVEPEPAHIGPEHAPEPEPAAIEPDAHGPEHFLAAHLEPDHDLGAPEPEAFEYEAPHGDQEQEHTASESRRGFFARIMDRLRPRPIDPVAEEPPLPEEPPVHVYEVDVEELTGGTVRPAHEGETYAGRSREPAAGPGAALAHFAPAPRPEPGPESFTPVLDEDASHEALAGAEAPAIDPIAPPAEPAAEPQAASPAAPDLGEELRAAEESGDEDVQAVLTAALDRLGSAHHRPFSRA
jgi:hypothetical protein